MLLGEVFHNAPIGMALIEATPAGAVFEVNDALCRMLGSEREELIGRTVQDFTHPDDLLEGADAHRALLAGEIPAYHRPKRFVRKDGATVWAIVSSAIVRDDDGVPLYTIGQVQDITEQKRAEQALLERERELERAQRLDAIGRLASGIAHDFNNMLAVIANYASLLSEQLSEQPALREDVEEIRRAVERGTALTRKLLVFTRQDDRAAHRPVHVDRLVDGMLRLLRTSAGERIRIVIDRPEDGPAPLVLADPDPLEQVLLNLVINARDAIEGDGRVTIRTRADADAVVLSVEDDGEGMTADVAERAFDPFFTTKPVGQGTGLGLATTKAIVTRFDGQVEVRSTPGAGTCVTVRLPRLAAPTATPGAGPRPSPSPADAGGLRVLVVEDEPAVRTAVVRILERAGHEAIAARDPHHAVDLARRSDRIDALVTDVVMPGMSGPLVAEAVLAAHPGARVVYMSGYAADHLDFAPGTPLLQKPFGPDELLAALRTRA